MHKYIPLYSRVRLITDKYLEEGAKQGDTDYIIEQYAERYEVEFSDSHGITIALIVVDPEDIINDEP